MSTHKFTPGERKLIIPANASEYVLVRNEKECVYAGKNEGEDLANALLISAAPTLLESCITLLDNTKTLYDTYRELNESKPNKVYVELMKVLKEEIAKGEAAIEKATKV